MKFTSLCLGLGLLTGSWAWAQGLSLAKTENPLWLKIPISFKVQQDAQRLTQNILYRTESPISEVTQDVDPIIANLAYLNKLYQNPCAQWTISIVQKSNCQIQNKSGKHWFSTSDSDLVKEQRGLFNQFLAINMGDFVSISEPIRSDGVWKITFANNWRIRYTRSMTSFTYHKSF